MRRGLIGVALLVVALGAHPAAAAFAPLNQPGPRLSIPQKELKASLSCTDGVRNADREPVLLIPATTVNSRQNFGWNYEPALRHQHIPYCTTDMPGDLQFNMGDMQTRGEYVTYAIRRVHAMAGRRIAVMGHSQGGMIMRWPLRFWPGTRRMVRDVIGFAGTNHGSALVPGFCLTSCAPALWQQRDDAMFIRALNSGQETFGGIDYTEVYSHLDEFVQPNLDDSGTSSLHGPGRITNVALQDICPLDTSEHLLIGITDPVAWAIALDALTHRGPADTGRIDPGVCGKVFMPGVDKLTGPVDLAGASEQVALQLNIAPKVDAEPELRCYVTASCQR
ncbi:MAG: hypothetical protein QOG62_2156 [Thermoleophilaceae bacterium]|nr:hypothetical protein [Thermoleophilaceae bacterium]